MLLETLMPQVNTYGYSVTVFNLEQELQSGINPPGYIKQIHAGGAFAAIVEGSEIILLADDLLGQLTQEETQTIIGHEVGHLVHGDLQRAVANGDKILDDFEAELNADAFSVGLGNDPLIMAKAIIKCTDRAISLYKAQGATKVANYGQEKVDLMMTVMEEQWRSVLAKRMEALMALA